MKTKSTSKLAGFCAVILLIPFGVSAAETAQFRPVSPDAISDILNLISEQARSNYERIRTWEGDIDVERRVMYEGAEAQEIFKTLTDASGEIPKRVLESAQMTIQFRADLGKGLFYSINHFGKPVQYVDFDTGKNLAIRATFGYDVSIVTPEYYLYLDSSIPDNGAGAVRAAIKEKPPAECLPCEIQSIFDPRTLFGTPEPIWKTVPQVLETIRKSGQYVVDGHSLRVENHIEGSLSEYRLRIPVKSGPAELIFITRTFSSAKGYNPVLVESTEVEGKVIQKGTLDYELIERVFLPAKTGFQRFVAKDGQAYYEKHATLKNQRINKPIAADTFTFRNLGLKNGDKLIDKIEGKDYVYRDGRLILVGK